MAFTIIKQDEPVPFNKSLVCVLFGEPGMGKTSLSFTSRDPLVLDFDDGVRRSVGRKDTVKFETWNDVLEFMDSDAIKKYKTLVVDTGGTMLDDFVALHIIRMDPKYGNGAGGLGLKGYGIMKDAFTKFLLTGSKMGIESFIFICHTSEKGDDDGTRLKPKVTGGSYDVLISKADLVGYLEMKNGVATLDFNPTTRHIGKNCAEFKAMPVPKYTEPGYPDFMTRVLDQTRDRMNKMSEAQVAAVALMNEMNDTITGFTEIAELENILAKINDLSPVYRVQTASMWDRRYAALWSPTFMDPEKTKTPEDFEALSAAVKDLPSGVQVVLRSMVGEFAKKQNIKYDKDLKKFMYITAPVLGQQSPAQQTPPAADAKEGGDEAGSGTTKETKAKGKDKKAESAQSTLALEAK